VSDLKDLYENRYETILKTAAEDLARHLASIFEDQKRIDRISSRAKDPKSFIKKASKVDPDGNPKYTNPITEIQDQIGARIIVFYTSDLESTKNLIEEYLRPIEIKSKHPVSDDAF
jgi:ppGpp synthetase/RelA/SpoT-type nucleotidyltranferase